MSLYLRFDKADRILVRDGHLELGSSESLNDDIKLCWPHYGLCEWNVMGMGLVKCWKSLWRSTWILTYFLLVASIIYKSLNQYFWKSYFLVLIIYNLKRQQIVLDFASFSIGWFGACLRFEWWWRWAMTRNLVVVVVVANICFANVSNFARVCSIGCVAFWRFADVYWLPPLRCLPFLKVCSGSVCDLMITSNSCELNEVLTSCRRCCWLLRQLVA